MSELQKRETRLRRMAAQQGLILGRERRAPFLPGGRGYILFADPDQGLAMLSHAERRSPVSVFDRGYQGTIDEIEAYLRRGHQAVRHA
jgi:hypothetical protein